MTTPITGTGTKHDSLMTTMIAASLLLGIDSSMVNVALPAIETGLSSNRQELSWLVVGNNLGLIVAGLCVGWSCARYGRRTVWCCCLTMFMVLAGLCAAATSIEVLVVLRTLQGAAAAPIHALSLSILLDEKPSEAHPSAISFWSAVSFLGPIAGSLIGGATVELFGWNAIFIVEVVLCTPLLILSPGVVRQTSAERSVKFDLFGLVTVGSAIVALQLGAARGAVEFLSPLSIAAIVVFLAGISLFLLRQPRVERPIVDTGMFTDRSFAASMSLIAILGLLMYAVSFVFPLYIFEISRFGSLAIGLLVVPRTIATICGSVLSGKLAGTVGFPQQTALGFGLIAVGTAGMIPVGQDLTVTQIIIAGVILGLGLGVSSSALNIQSFATLPLRMRDEAASIRLLVRNLGGAIGVAWIGAATAVGPNTLDRSAAYHSAFVVVAAIAVPAGAAALLFGCASRKPDRQSA